MSVEYFGVTLEIYFIHLNRSHISDDSPIPSKVIGRRVARYLKNKEINVDK